jgi:hypothetical protein
VETKDRSLDWVGRVMLHLLVGDGKTLRLHGWCSFRRGIGVHLILMGGWDLLSERGRGIFPSCWGLSSVRGGHHRIAFEYDEDTVSLEVDPALSTLDISICNNSNSSAGNSSAFEYECYEVKDDTPRFNYHWPKIKIPKQESPMTICTADTIGTIRS